jgi:hypothetical protein
MCATGLSLHRDLTVFPKPRGVPGASDGQTKGGLPVIRHGLGCALAEPLAIEVRINSEKASTKSF